MQKLLEVQVGGSKILLFYDCDKVVCIKHFGGAEIVKTSTIMVDYNDVMNFVGAFAAVYAKKPDYYSDTQIYFNNLKEIEIKTNKPSSVTCFKYTNDLRGIWYFVLDKRITGKRAIDYVVLGPDYAIFSSLTKVNIFIACLAELEI